MSAPSDTTDGRFAVARCERVGHRALTWRRQPDRLAGSSTADLPCRCCTSSSSTCAERSPTIAGCTGRRSPACSCNRCCHSTYLLRLPAEARSDLESLNEHGSAIGMNLVFTMTVLALAYRGISWRVRVTLLLASAPVCGSTCCAAPRRLRRSRRGDDSLRRDPLLATTAHLLEGRPDRDDRLRRRTSVRSGVRVSTIGFPAQAVKTVVAPDSLGAADQSSDEYRTIENYNLHYTIRVVTRSPVRDSAAVPPTGPTRRHQRLRVQRLPSAQLTAVDLDQDGVPRVRDRALPLRDHADARLGPCAPSRHRAWTCSPSRAP